MFLLILCNRMFVKSPELKNIALLLCGSIWAIALCFLAS